MCTEMLKRLCRVCNKSEMVNFCEKWPLTVFEIYARTEKIFYLPTWSGQVCSIWYLSNCSMISFFSNLEWPDKTHSCYKLKIKYNDSIKFRNIYLFQKDWTKYKKRKIDMIFIIILYQELYDSLRGRVNRVYDL